MLKNKMGYLLAETIIAITVVATVITIVYAITTNYYIKQDDEVTKYNTPQGLYTAEQVRKLCSPIEEKYFYTQLQTSDYIPVNLDSKLNNNLNIDNIYFSKNDLTSLIRDERFSTRIKRFLKDKNNEYIQDNCKYRYVLIFNDDSYSVIGSHCDE